MKKIKRTDLLAVLGFVLIMLFGIAYKFLMRGNSEGVVPRFTSTEVNVSSVNSVTLTESYKSLSDTEITEITESETVEAFITVYICGEVNNPGIYEVKSGTMLYELVEQAGGLTDKAPVNNINMVFTLLSDISIYIPSSDENLSSGDSYIIRPDNEAFLSGNMNYDDETDGGQRNLVNINTADKAELMTLPGIGEVTAEAIIAYREVHVFEKIEDVMNVSGIGEGKYAQIKDYICV